MKFSPLPSVSEEDAIKLLKNREHETLPSEDYDHSLKPGELPHQAQVFGIHANLNRKNASIVSTAIEQIKKILEEISEQKKTQAHRFFNSLTKDQVRILKKISMG